MDLSICVRSKIRENNDCAQSWLGRPLRRRPDFGIYPPRFWCGPNSIILSGSSDGFRMMCPNHRSCARKISVDARCVLAFLRTYLWLILLIYAAGIPVIRRRWRACAPSIILRFTLDMGSRCRLHLLLLQTSELYVSTFFLTVRSDCHINKKLKK